MKNKTIFFSFLLCVYNEEEHLIEKCLQSICDQSFKAFELIIVVDNPDFKFSIRSLEILNNIENKKIIYNNKNIGLTKSLNKGVKFTSGVYVVRQDADDYSHVDRLKRAFEIQQEVNYSAYTTPAIILGNKNISPNFIIRKFYSPNILRYRNIFFHGSLIIRRDVLKSNLYDEYYRFSQDFELYNRLFDNNLDIYYDKNWVSYFQNPNAKNISTRHPLRQLYYFKTVLKKNKFLWTNNFFIRKFKLDYFLTFHFYFMYKLFNYRQ